MISFSLSRLLLVWQIKCNFIKDFYVSGKANFRYGFQTSATVKYKQPERKKKNTSNSLTLVPSSGIFVHFSWLFYFYLVIISAVLQLLAVNFVRSLILSQIFKSIVVNSYMFCILSWCILHPLDTFVAKMYTPQETAIKSSYINVFFYFFFMNHLNNF